MKVKPLPAQVRDVSVIVEFTLPTDAFVFGDAVTAGAIQIDLEAIVPIEGGAMPYFWATGADLEPFERNVRASPAVTELTLLDRIEDSALYRVVWIEMDGLLAALVETDAVVLEGHNNDGWRFRVRFPDHDRVGQFYNRCTERDVPIHVERVYTLLEPSQTARSLDLTDEQRAALLIAVREGYFRVPRETTLTEIADELGISQQAASQRVRRGVDAVLRAVLLGPGEGV